MTAIKTCRACLKSLFGDGKNLSDGIQKSGIIISYRQAFEKCSGFEVLDAEPQDICIECSSELLFSLQFKQKCEETQGKLQNWLKVKQEIKEPDIKLEIFAENISVEDNCDDRQEDFRDENNCDDRQEDFSDEVDFKCYLCEKENGSRQKLLDHMNRVHPKNKTEPCECCKKTQHPQEMENHLKVCLIKRLMQKKQEKRLAKKKLRSKKVEKETEGTPGVKIRKRSLCPICGLIQSLSHITMHIARQYPISKGFICDLCGAQITTIHSMRRHMATVHLKKGHKCRKCDETFTTGHQLIKHTRLVHPGVLSIIKCEYCGDTFSNYASLRKHRALHTGERFHKCNICGKGFVQSNSLKNHMASHSDERPYACEYCGSAFKTMKHLKSHRKNHEEHEYECPLCDKTFSSNQYLKDHLIRYHPEYELPPRGTIMNKKFRIMMKEKKLREEAIKAGMDAKQVEKIVVTEVPSLDELLLVQKHHAKSDAKS